ncbi:hypothetical protein M0740_21120, partial [Salmonella enterica]|nr:hypothetical protein [Salmonella enterica]MDV3319385.1 hypothetical protein [Salmonella enterica]
MIMKVNTWTILLMSAHLTACAVPGTEKYQTSMDSVTAEKISRIIQSNVIPYKGENHGEVISRVSSAFLGAKWHLNRSQFGIRIDHDLASISDHS